MKMVYTAAGLLATAAGFVGVFLPVIPTVPFLLLAAFCFAKGSEKLNIWLKNTDIYKENIDDLASGRGMTREAKIRVMATMTVIMVVAAFFMRNSRIGCICLAVVWVCHALAMVFFVKTRKEEDCGENEGRRRR